MNTPNSAAETAPTATAINGPIYGAIPLIAGSGYLPGLDGLRAASILIVLAAHFGFDKIIPGGLGVTVFFFVSGFLITRLLVGEQNKSGTIALKAFYIRRFLRLAPALLAFVILVSLLCLAANVPLLWRHVFVALFYGVNYYDVLDLAFGWPQRQAPWAHLWSLAVEEHFYILFPAMLMIFGRNHQKRLWLVWTMIGVSAAFRLWAVFGIGVSGDYTYQATEMRLESIAWGCLLAIMLDGASGKPKNTTALRFLINWPCLIFAIGALLFTLVFRDEGFRATLRYSVQGAALFIFVLNLYGLQSFGFAIGWLDIAPARFLGRLSYSLYLWHIPAIFIALNVLGLPMRTPLNIGVSAVLGLAFALISYHGIERPMFALRKRFGGQPVEMLKRAD